MMIPRLFCALLLWRVQAFQVPSPPSSQRSSSSSTQLSSLRNSDRAYFERSLEDMMDNDWRVFRAKLVAQEQQQEEEEFRRRHTRSSHHHHRHHDHHHLDERLQRQGHLGDLFAGTIGNIFVNHKQQQQPPPHPSQHHHQQHQQQPPPYSSRYDRSIFDGDAIGGISSRESSYEQHLHFASATSGNGHQQQQSNRDPFVSPDELPVHMPLTTPVTINKHRWAHPISHLEPGCVLLANEKLGGVFHQTVVLIIEHHEHAGTLGIIINRYVSSVLPRFIVTSLSSNRVGFVYVCVVHWRGRS
jgi:putative transcriptional regulator